MGFIPQGAKWYLADIIQEITAEGDPRNVVHVNMLLVRSNSPEEAYQRAMELGAEVETTYEKTKGQQVRSRFRGLRQLSVIHDELEHGAELCCSKVVGVVEDVIQQWVCTKEELSIFAPSMRSSGPNYVPRCIADAFDKRFPQLQPKADK